MTNKKDNKADNNKVDNNKVVNNKVNNKEFDEVNEVKELKIKHKETLDLMNKTIEQINVYVETIKDKKFLLKELEHELDLIELKIKLIIDGDELEKMFD